LNFPAGDGFRHPEAALTSKQSSGNPSAVLLKSAPMLTTDRASGTVLAFFAVLVIWESRHLPLGTVRQPGPAFFPILLALLLLIFAVFVVLSGGRTPLLSSIPWNEWRHALAILGASIFSVFAIERLGYRVTVLLVLIFLVKIVEKRGWIVSLAFAFALSFGSFFLFYTVLRVPLPEGPLGF
jgi:putative tricarboxylic transport membrane protein